MGGEEAGERIMLRLRNDSMGDDKIVLDPYEGSFI
jgi:hypothetical protein